MHCVVTSESSSLATVQVRCPPEWSQRAVCRAERLIVLAFMKHCDILGIKVPLASDVQGHLVTLTAVGGMSADSLRRYLELSAQEVIGESCDI
jgi:hypothetical protein